MAIEAPGLQGQVVPLDIADVYHSDEGGFGEQVAIAHYAHVDRLLPDAERQQARIIQVFGRDPLALARLASDIEAQLQHGDPPVQAHVSGGTDNVLGRFGNVAALLRAVMLALAACVLLVFISIAAHLAAQRRASMAMLQALGFGRAVQLAAITLEVAAVVAAGTMSGVVLGLWLVDAVGDRTAHLLGRLQPPFEHAPWLAAGLVGLVVLSSVAPALTVRTLRPVDLARS